MTDLDLLIVDAALRAAFDLGKRCGLEGDCWEGQCPFDPTAQSSLRTAWKNGFMVGRLARDTNPAAGLKASDRAE